VPFLDSEFLESARAEAMQRSQDAIAGARQMLSGTGVEVSESISVLLDTPKSIILNEAVSWKADLIVLGSHGRRGVDRFLMGSVSEAVAMHADCSVAVVRAADTSTR
jgi:nucleotide-binding universal stress UspA family protein